MLLAMVSFSYLCFGSSGLFVWALAGPWFGLQYEWSMADMIVWTIVLAAAFLSHSIRPNAMTAVLTLFAGGVWFLIGFGTIVMSI